MDNLVMEVRDFLAINNANIEINKINVVGGVNGSGKSTLSKIFYSLLKANSTKRKDNALQSIVDDINDTIDKLNYEDNEYNLPNHLKINDNYQYIIKKYNEVLESFYKQQKMAVIKLIDLNKEMEKTLDNLVKNLENNGFDMGELTYANKWHDDSLKNIKSRIRPNEIQIDDEVSFSDRVVENIRKNDNISIFADDVAKAIDDFDNIVEKFNPLTTFCIQMAEYENIVVDGVYNNFLTEEMQEYFKDINKMRDYQEQWIVLLSIIDYNDLDFPILDPNFKIRMDRFFGEDSPMLSRDCLREIFSKESIMDKRYKMDFMFDYNFKLYINSCESKIDAFDYFFHKGFVNSVYYVDNLSIIDLGIKHDNNFHLNELLGDLSRKIVLEIDFKSDIFQSYSTYGSEVLHLDLNQDVKNILEKIENIIAGSYELNFYFGGNDVCNFYFKNNNYDFFTFSSNTASGIKQIGIIQLLLLNNNLKKDGYLIIDEPEVNLHPEWQFKFAEILVLLAKDLNITVYLNSHSPFFIEAIDAFTEFYDMQDDVNYYLTEESEVEGKYNFTKIGSDELYKIYDNLGNAYDLINQLRLRKRLK